MEGELGHHVVGLGQIGEQADPLCGQEAGLAGDGEGFLAQLFEQKAAGAGGTPQQPAGGSCQGWESIQGQQRLPSSEERRARGGEVSGRVGKHVGGRHDDCGDGQPCLQQHLLVCRFPARYKIGVLHNVGLDLAWRKIVRGGVGECGRGQCAGPGHCWPEQAGQQPTEQKAGPKKLGREPPGAGVAHSRSDYSMEVSLCERASGKDGRPFSRCGLSNGLEPQGSGGKRAFRHFCYLGI